ncbi:MAG: type I DNA topoisomerase [Candidatus Promineifilaceae bacterium]|nr:type I DNA topoisomerase [Candidatus Promineifilaceae bacterium]
MSEDSIMEGYCFKCKEKREMENPTAEYSANGSPGTRGICPVCGGTIYKMGRTPAHEHLPKPEITKQSKKKPKKSRKKKGSITRRSGRLVVVESPAKARTIGRYLGRGYAVKSSVGHIRDLLKSRLSVDVENDFEPEYRVPNDKRKVVKELKAAAAKSKEIFLATDSDREGEAIAWHVQEAAEIDPERTRRVVFNEITKPAIQAAFENPREIDMDRVNAQQARRILDRLVGYKLSPLLWRKVRGRLSAGRVQSVAVRLVVEREREIEQFVPQEHWSISAQLSELDFRGEDPRPYFMAKLHRLNGKKPELHKEEDVKPHVSALESVQWTVGKVKIGTRKRRPAAPFTTSTLQQEASRRLKFGTNKTMRLAQQLYEGVDAGTDETVGLITYMRTDSVAIAQEAQKEARDFIDEHYGNALLPKKPPVYRTKAKSAQEAHEAIRPTSVYRSPKKMKPYLSRDQYRIYRLIWERFVASQMASAIYDTVSADIWAGDEQTAAKKRPYLFRATGSTLRFAGFLTLYEESRPQDAPDDVDAQHPVPVTLVEGKEVDMLKLLPEQHFTQPPPRFSEATLVKALEENGIGRPSTYASIITTIQNRGYVFRENRRLVPTETGRIVNDLLVEYFPDILSVDFTARMESDLDSIADGKAWVPIISDFYGDFEKELAKADEALPKLDLKEEPELVGRECPTCGNPLVYREGRYGRFIGCSTFPKCRYTEQILVKVGVTCPHGGGEIVERKTRRGRTWFGCTRYPECEWTSWKKPVPEQDGSCDGLIVQVNKETTDCVSCGLLKKVVDEAKVPS